MNWICFSLAAVVIAILLSGLIWAVRFIAPNRIGNIEEHLSTLLRQGYHGAFVRLEHDRSGMFLQIKKYISDEEYGIELAFPDVEWSRGLIERTEQLSKVYGFEATRVSNKQRTFSFLYVDFGQDVERAARFCRSIMTDVFHISDRERLIVGFAGLSYGREFPSLAEHPENFEFFDRHRVD